MKNKLILLCGLAFVATTMIGGAQSVQRATDRAYDAAAKYQVRNYQPVAGPTGYQQAPGRVSFRMAVTEGTDYVFIIGTHDVRRIRVYVMDEWGQPLSKDVRGLDMAALGFFARYSGNVKVTVMFDSTAGLGAYSTLVCKRPGGAKNWEMLDAPDKDFELRTRPSDPAKTTTTEEDKDKPVP